MSVSLEEFYSLVLESELVPEVELRMQREKHRPKDAQELAKRLVREGLLTHYQASMIYQGRGSHLVLGEYAIQSKLGAGGMGLVFKALHRSMHRAVALKILPKSAVNSDELVRRFQREMRALARLSHVNIVAALDASKSKGVHYLVMEYVEGKDLAGIVQQQGPLSVSEAVNCLLQAAKGLQYAHSRGITHRDIKPSNLLLNHVGCVKILDLGLARIERLNPEESATEEDLTATGLILGSFDYLAPEQADNFKLADQRSDIYSLGCTLHFLLTGRPVYTGSSAIQKILAHRESPIPLLREAVPQVPEELECLFQSMLAKSPDDRPQSMEEVSQQLQRCVPDADRCQVALDRSQLPSSSRRYRDPSTLLREKLSDSTSESDRHAADASQRQQMVTPAADSELEIGRWILSIGGTLIVRRHDPPAQVLNIGKANQLAEGSCSILQCSFPAGYELRFDQARRLVELQELRSLFFLGGKIEAESISCLTSLPKLRNLDLSNVRLDENAFGRIWELISLTGLNLSATGVTDRCLRGVSKLENLKLLSLDDNRRITSIGLQSLTGLSRLDSLYLSRTAVIDLGLEVLHCAVPKVQNLALAGTPVSDAAADWLIGFTKLQDLDLSATRLSDRGLKKLSQLISLRHLSVTASRVSPTGVAQFCHSCPNCEVDAFE